MRLGASRFVAGETLDQCGGVIRVLNQQGFKCNAALLGEAVASAADADRAVAEYQGLIKRLATEHVNCNVAIKLTLLGLDLGEELAESNMVRLLELSAELGLTMRIDMEDSAHVESTLKIYRNLLARGCDNVGVVLGSAKAVGRAVVMAALVGIVFELVPFVAIVFAAPSITSFLHSGTPLTYVAGRSFGSDFQTIITVGALLAIFNASVAITLQFARIVWATGRDRAWPEPISSWIGKVEPHRGAPWVATLFVGTLATILCFQSSLIAVVTFTAVLLVVLYGLIAISALVSRVRQRDLPRPSKMPFWPLPPIITLVGVVIALTQQKVSDLITVVVLFAVAAAYYFIFVAPRQGRYWVQANLPDPYDTAQPLPAQD